MKYEIGEYGLTKEKVVIGWLGDGPINFLWYVEDSVSETNYSNYNDAVDAIVKKMRSDKETGRQDECLAEKDGHIILYFTAGWSNDCCTIIMHISDSYPKEILDMVREYDDRIIVERI